ncbi:MAG: hypothetical protein ACUVQ5_06745 [Candidatus Methanomethylicaceae archaeon]
MNRDVGTPSWRKDGHYASILKEWIIGAIERITLSNLRQNRPSAPQQTLLGLNSIAHHPAAKTVAL